MNMPATIGFSLGVAFSAIVLGAVSYGLMDRSYALGSEAGYSAGLSAHQEYQRSGEMPRNYETWRAARKARIAQAGVVR